MKSDETCNLKLVFFSTGVFVEYTGAGFTFSCTCVYGPFADDKHVTGHTHVIVQKHTGHEKSTIALLRSET